MFFRFFKRPPMEGKVRLIVGLGNPGPQYAWTRHNLGFMVAARLADDYSISLNKKRFEAHWGQGRIEQESVILAQPMTYMNLSGRAVGALLNYFRLTPEQLIVVHDDLDVPLARLKIVDRGGAGGHRGVQSIMGTLGTDAFLRVKLGVGRPPPGLPAEAFVLRPFDPDEEEAAAGLVERGALAVATLVTQGLAAARNEFHRHPDSPSPHSDGSPTPDSDGGGRR